MTPSDLRRIALSLEGVEESSHMGAPDFRVGGHIFATLASQSEGYGNLMLTPELQSAFLQDQPEIFLPIHGGWGRMGMTHIRLAVAPPGSCASKRTKNRKSVQPPKSRYVDLTNHHRIYLA
jgi:YjbR